MLRITEKHDGIKKLYLYLQTSKDGTYVAEKISNNYNTLIEKIIPSHGTYIFISGMLSIFGLITLFIGFGPY